MEREFQVKQKDKFLGQVIIRLTWKYTAPAIVIMDILLSQGWLHVEDIRIPAQREVCQGGYVLQSWGEFALERNVRVGLTGPLVSRNLRLRLSLIQALIVTESRIPIRIKCSA